MSQKLKVSELIPHKDNDYFFDDIQGEAWQEFINSVKTSGVIEPIVVTPVKREDGGTDKVIVSGHQRVRACKTLGIEEINAEVMLFDSEDEILKCLIDTNIQQRGVGNPNPIKFKRCIDELERIAGIKRGNNQYDRIGQNALTTMTQEELASSYGISLDKWKRYKQLEGLIPEIETLVETNVVTPSVARAVIKKLPEFQQRELAEQLADNDGKVSKKEVQKYIDKIRELENRDPEVKTVVKEVVPEDYENLKEEARLSEIRRKDFLHMRDAYDEMADKWKKSEAEKQKLIDNAKKPEAENVERLKINAFSFCSGMSNFLESYGGYGYLMNEIDSLPDNQRKAVYDGVRAIYRWANEMLNVGITEVIE